MKNTSKSINRNMNLFDHTRSNITRNNLVTPEILVNQIWNQEDDTSGVKIIELNSSSDSSKDQADFNVKSFKNYRHAWSYVINNLEETEDTYRINEEARYRRRMTNENNFTTAYTNDYILDRDMQTNHNGFFSTYDYDPDSNTPMSHQRNCFTILNNKQNVTSDSSTDNENFETIEIVEVENTEDKKYWDHVYNDEIITYDPNTQTEKQTIYIYSYKNKRLLSENDFELVNIPRKDASSTSTSCYTSDEEHKIGTKTCRIESPIPATYIPRLDLSLVQTLSTVTEISETNKMQSNGSSYEKINFKPKHNYDWLTDRNDKRKQKEFANVVNWMALSPRERRRRSINTTFDTTGKANINEADITYAEGVKQCDETSIKSNKVASLTVQVRADVHVIHKETETINIEADILPIEISLDDPDTDVDVESVNREIDDTNKPHIEINSKLDKYEITEPIEKLNCSDWITEQKLAEKEISVYDYDLESTEEINDSLSSTENFDSASRKLWKRNLQLLMKPPDWMEYLPITCSPPSLHLSFSMTSLDSKKSWFKRLTSCIKCCK